MSRKCLGMSRELYRSSIQTLRGTEWMRVNSMKEMRHVWLVREASS